MDPNSSEDRSKFAGVMKKFYEEKGQHDFCLRKKEATPYEILMAEIFLQRTRRGQVADVFNRFISHFPDPNALAKADFEEVRYVMEPLGLHWRAKNVHKIGYMLLEEFDETVPSDESIFKLPGVGPYVGNMILCLAYGKRTAPVDANVGRILNRVFGLGRKGKAERLSRDKIVLATAEKCLPKNGFREYNLALVDLGSSICKPRDPDCDSCPLSSCDYAQQEGRDLNR